MILIIDNYDSFSYNLYQMIGAIKADIQVIRNDELTVAEIAALNPEAIIISPGPGHPEGAGITVEVIRELAPRFPILGVCLGLQAIGIAYGATVSYAKELMHGKQSSVALDLSNPLFEDCSETTLVARYHSLAIIEETLPEVLQVIARADDNEIMAVKHKDYNLYGVQFHPESIMTPKGNLMIHNFINLAGSQS